MPWEFSDDVEVYAEKAWDLLATRPAENTVALTVIDSLRAGRRRSAAPLLFGWYGATQTSGAVSLTPPYELLLAVVPEGTEDELAGALRERHVSVPGVVAEAQAAGRFATAWTVDTALCATTTMRQRLYALGTLVPPELPGSGGARRARQADIDLATRWWEAFHRETGGHAVEVAPIVRDRIEHALMWLWEDDAGSVVSLAARHRAAARVARVGPVYTSPPHRGHGYGAAVTAASTSDALLHDADHVVLFADLANPTSNAIYQRVGYLPLCDHHVVRFS